MHARAFASTSDEVCTCSMSASAARMESSTGEQLLAIQSVVGVSGTRGVADLAQLA